MSNTQYKLNIIHSDYTYFKLEMVEDPTICFDFYNKADMAKTLFHNDIVTYSNDQLSLVDRKPVILTGELEIYSKYILKSNTNSPCYIFRPIDNHYPKFMVTFGQKAKYGKNIIVRVENLTWCKTQSLPCATILSVIGQIDSLDCLLDSTIYARDLMPNYTKINKKTLCDSFSKLLEAESIKREKVELPIISIDPEGCRDIDDAFSYSETPTSFTLQIHIADVYTVLSCLGYYNSFISGKLQSSTIYLPTGKNYPMLPELFSINLCSLLEKQVKLMLTIEIKHNKCSGESMYRAFPSIGKITRNYSYDNCPRDYVEIYGYLEKIYSYFTKQRFHITDSHNMVECLMLTYNYLFGQINKNLAIYRIQDRGNDQQQTISTDPMLSRFLQVISSKSAIYSFKESIHSSLNLTGYTHMSSPIRRLVDLIGQEIYYTGSSLFISKNPYILDSINRQSKAIKYLERDMNKLKLAHMAYTSANNKYITHCYVYKVDIDKNKKYIYFPRENISIVDRIIHSSLLDNTSITIDNNCLLVYNDSVNQTIKLNSLVEVHLYGNPDIFNIDDSLLISF